MLNAGLPVAPREYARKARVALEMERQLTLVMDDIIEGGGSSCATTGDISTRDMPETARPVAIRERRVATKMSCEPILRRGCCPWYREMAAPIAADARRASPKPSAIAFGRLPFQLPMMAQADLVRREG